MVENGGKQPLGSKALPYLPRKVGGRSLKFVETKYKLIKIKTAVNFCQDHNENSKRI